MKKMLLNIHILSIVRDDNDLDPWDITLWGREVLAELDENRLASNFVRSDYDSNDIQRYGRTINARIAREMKFKRRNHRSPVKKQPLVGETVPLELNQLWHTSFTIDDWGSTRSFGDIAENFLTPAARALSRGMNASILGLAPQFIERRGGRLQGLTPSNGLQYITEVNTAMNVKQDWGGAPMFINNDTRGELLQVGEFVKVNESGSNEVLTRAQLGMKMDMVFYKSSNVPGTRVRTPVADSTTASAAAPGASTVVLADATGFAAAQRVAIAGRPYRIASVDAGTDTLTLTSPLLEGVDSGAVVETYALIGIDHSDGYGKGHAEGVLFSATVYEGDILDIEHDNGGFGTYTVVQIDGNEILLDRPLEDAVSDSNDVSPWPAGAYNLGFSRNAILMATRPLPIPRFGDQNLVASTVVDYNGIGVRITATYDGDYQEVLVTLDILGGLVPVMKNEGGVLLG